MEGHLLPHQGVGFSFLFNMEAVSHHALLGIWSISSSQMDRSSTKINGELVLKTVCVAGAFSLQCEWWMIEQ